MFLKKKGGGHHSAKAVRLKLMLYSILASAAPSFVEHIINNTRTTKH